MDRVNVKNGMKEINIYNNRLLNVFVAFKRDGSDKLILKII